MPAWSEQLAKINELRNQRQESDQDLYAAKIQLANTNSALKQLNQKQTDSPRHTTEKENILSQISLLQQQLQQLNKEAAVLQDLEKQIRDNKNEIDFLTKKMSAVESSMEGLENELDIERQNEKPDTKKIITLEKESDGLRELFRQLQRDHSIARREGEQLRLQQQQNEQSRREIEEKRIRNREETARLQNDLADLTKPVEGNVQELEGKKKELEDAIQRNYNAMEEIRNSLHSLVTSLYPNEHPKHIVTNLVDDIPFLLLPVRIETRFVSVNNNPELWIRIYPDEIAIHTHEKTLTDKEVADGEYYWKLIFDAERIPDTESENKKKTAWSALAESFGPSRAGWISRKTKPSNWTAALNGNE